jgi:hypothetical protein
MKKTVFAGHNIYSTNVEEENINIDQILKEFYQNTEKYQYTHYIKKRWENIYLSPQDVPSVLPFLSFAMSTALEIFRDVLEPHQTLIIPHALLGYEKNEFWFNAASEGQSTRMHNHNEQALVSGVFYLKAPNNSANIFFKSGKDEELKIEPKTGKIVFFPSVLDHYVPENTSSETRISLAFNCYKFPISASIAQGLPV